MQVGLGLDNVEDPPHLLCVPRVCRQFPPMTSACGQPVARIGVPDGYRG
jgi:hypothetical protein